MKLLQKINAMKDISSLFTLEGELDSSKTLADEGLIRQPVVLETQKSMALESVKLPAAFSMDIGGAFSVSLFNGREDGDEMGLVGTTADYTLPFNPAVEAVLKYGFRFFPKINVAGSVREFGLAMSWEKGIDACLYRRYPKETVIRDVVKNDMQVFSGIFASEVLSELRPGDALAFRVEGLLKTSVAISWSTILSKALRQVASIVSGSMSLDIAVAASAKANFGVEIQDHFSYVVKKTATQGFEIAISKAKNTSKRGGAGYQIGAGLKDSEELASQLDELLEKGVKTLLDEPVQAVSHAVEKLKKGQPTPEQRVILGKIGGLLGVPSWEEETAELQQRWEGFKENYREILKDAAKTTASLAVSYEYSKLEEGKELLQAKFPSPEMMGYYHAGFLQFDLSGFLKDYTLGILGDVAIQAYFNQQTTTIESTFGFGLKLGKLKAIESRDSRKSTEIVQRDTRGHQQVSLSRLRGYNWSFGQEGAWLSQMDARMNAFSLDLEPSFSEFEWGWMFKFYGSNIKITSKVRLRELFDSAANWGCIHSQEIDPLTGKYFPELENQSIGFQKQIYFSNSYLHVFFQQLYQLGSDEKVSVLLAKALASSLRYQEGFPLRETPEIRQQVYAPVWKYFMENPQTSSRQLASLTFDHLIRQPSSGNLAAREKAAGRSSGNVWLGDVVYAHPNLITDLNACVRGMQEIGEGISRDKAFYPQFDQSYKRIAGFLGQSFYLDVLGSFLLSGSSGNTLASGETEKTISFSFGKENESILQLGGR